MSDGGRARREAFTSAWDATAFRISLAPMRMSLCCLHADSFMSTLTQKPLNVSIGVAPHPLAALSADEGFASLAENAGSPCAYHCLVDTLSTG